MLWRATRVGALGCVEGVGCVRGRVLSSVPTHSAISREQSLWWSHESSPGSPFFLPAGMVLMDRLASLVEWETRRSGYARVSTPQLFKPSLWETSGHWQAYRGDMYGVVGAGEGVDGEKEDWGVEFGLKPMNCPAHCLLYAASPRHEAHLPLRFAEVSPLHRNEASGALAGLTRVRRFHQDDAHVFCTPLQVRGEVEQCLEMVGRVWGMLGFKSDEMQLVLSTRPEERIGGEESWDAAESALQEALEWYCGETGASWEENSGDGAFYGPKIDVLVRDSLGRQQQCATVQLDFNLPERFDLSYQQAEDGEKARVVIVHRAILGSLERCIAVVAEHWAGKWPFWLSPRQVLLLPIHGQEADKAVEKANTLHSHLTEVGCVAQVDSDVEETLSKRIKNAHKRGWNVVAVIGDQEVESDTIAVRSRDAATSSLLQRILEEGRPHSVVRSGKRLPSLPPTPPPQPGKKKKIATVPTQHFLHALEWMMLPEQGVGE